MKKKVNKLAHGLLATSLMGCGVSSEVTAHPPATFASEPTTTIAADEHPAQARPGRPQPAARPLATVAATTTRRPTAQLAEKPAAAAPELAIGSPNRRIQSGRIIDESGQPLVGATVLLKGTTRGTSTDANGDYSLPVPLGTNTFVFAHIGYQEEVDQSRDGQPLTVTLLPVPGFTPPAPAVPLPKSKARLPHKQLPKAKE
jgi:hypothetical protein